MLYDMHAPPPPTIDWKLREEIAIRFGDGMQVVDVTTGFEPTRVIIRGVPPDLEERDINWYLRPYGSPISISLRNDREGTAERIANVTFMHHHEARRAIEHLDGKPDLGTTFPLTVEFDSGAAENMRGSKLIADTIIISWRRPLTRVKLSYRDPRDAVSQADIIPLRTYKGARLNVRLSGSRSVVIVEGIPPGADLTELAARHRPDDDPAFLDDNYNHNDAIQRLETLIESLECPKRYDIQEKGREVKIWVNFNSTQDASAFKSLLNKEEFPWRSIARLSILQPWDIIYVTSLEKYNSLQDDVDRIKKQFSEENIHIRISTPTRQSEIRHIRVRGGGNVKAVKTAMDLIFSGEMVLENGKPLWDQELASLYGSTLISDLHVRNASVLMDCQRRAFLIFGSQQYREQVTEMLKCKMNSLRRRLHSYNFPRHQLSFFVKAVDNELEPKLGHHNVWLDSKQCKITVSGKSEANHVLNTLIAKALRIPSPALKQSDKYGGLLCLVCLGQLTDPIKLNCGHHFCKSCLSKFLLSATQYNASFPLTCFGKNGQCGQPIPLQTFKALLNEDDMLQAMRKSFDFFIHTHAKEFRHCPTADCPQIYRVCTETETPPSSLHCTSCLGAFCPACGCEGGHEGKSCSQHREETAAEEEESVLTWMNDLGAHGCPNCGMGLVKDGGCSHVQCAQCKVHICWTCGKTFEAIGEESVYQHMNNEHGGIGLINPLVISNWATEHPSKQKQKKSSQKKQLLQSNRSKPQHRNKPRGRRWVGYQNDEEVTDEEVDSWDLNWDDDVDYNLEAL